MLTSKVAHGAVGVAINHQGILVLLQAVSHGDDEYCRICLTPNEARELINKLEKVIKKIEENHAQKTTDPNQTS